jgi:hypothetical protein
VLHRHADRLVHGRPTPGPSTQARRAAHDDRLTLNSCSCKEWVKVGLVSRRRLPREAMRPGGHWARSGLFGWIAGLISNEPGDDRRETFQRRSWEQRVLRSVREGLGAAMPIKRRLTEKTQAHPVRASWTSAIA